MNCPGCNNEVQAGASFCTKCGFQLKQPRGPQEMAAAASHPAAAEPVAPVSMSTPKHAVLAKKPPQAKTTLSAAAAKVASTKKVQGRFKIDECLALFEEIADFDTCTDKARGGAGKRALISFIAAFVSVFITAMSSFPPLAILVIGGVVYGFVNVAKWFKLKKQDLLNDFRLCIVPLLEMLREDIDKKERLKIDMNLSGPSPEKVVSKQELDPRDFGSHVMKVTRTTFRDPWCSIELPLLDGNIVSLRIENYYLKFDRKQRGSSGKTKFKTKWKKRSVARAMLEPVASEFTWDAGKIGGQPAEHKLKLKEKAGAKVCRAARKFKYKPEDRMAYITETCFNLSGPGQMDSCMHPRELFAMMLELFSLLNPVKAESK